MQFICYCQQVFPDKFKDGNILICYSQSSFLEGISNLKSDGLCILILEDQDSKILKKSLKLKERFSYYRFYSDKKQLYFVGTNDIKEYISDYTADYKLSLKDSRKTVVVYVFHIINENVKFFLQHGVFQSPDIDFIFVCSGVHVLEVPNFVKYLNRENIGYDFGAWSHAIFTENLMDKYDYFVLINSSVRGPFIPPWSFEKNWVRIFTRFLDYQTKLVGTTLGIDEYLTHIQSSVLVLDKIGLDIGIKDGIFEHNPINLNKRDVVIQKEIALSQCIMKYGYKIRPILSAYHNTEITQISVLRSRVHHLNNWYYGTNLHPYEIIFIKDNHDINSNKDIKLQTQNHNLGFAQTINPKVPPDFNWVQYLKLNPDIPYIYRNEIMATKHWLNFGFYEKRRF